MIMNNFDHHWIFWVGPVSGAILAGSFHYLIIKPFSGEKYIVNETFKTESQLQMDKL